MKKILVFLFAVALLIPQASFAAWAYKGIPLKPGTDTEVAEQISAIDNGTTATTTPSIQDQIALLVAQIEKLQELLAALQPQNGGNIVVMPGEPSIDRSALYKEAQTLTDSIDWNTCRNDRSCSPDTRTKLERINEITRITGSGCTYELTKNNVGGSCGG